MTKFQYYIKIYLHYDPEICRFITIDDISYLNPDVINGVNLYAYCGNNPIMYYDPTGNVAFLIAGLILLGGAIGFGAAVYTDYADDGEVFNGSVEWYDYLGATLLGGALGGLAGTAIGAIGGLSITIPTIGMIGAGGAVAVGAVTVTGTQVLVGAAAIAGLGVLFSKGYVPRMGHNQYEKKQWDEAMRQLGIKDKDLIKRLHYEVHKYPYQSKLRGLIEILRKILQKWGF